MIILELRGRGREGKDKGGKGVDAGKQGKG